MMSIDQGKSVIFVLLDFSVAFESVDHNVLFSKMEEIFGLSGKVLEWYQFYLEQHSQRVSGNGILSCIHLL